MVICYSLSADVHMYKLSRGMGGSFFFLEGGRAVMLQNFTLCALVRCVVLNAQLKYLILSNG